MSGEQAGSTSEAPLLFFRAYSALECGAFIRRRSWDEKMYLFLAHPVLRAEDLGGPDALLPTERAFTMRTSEGTLHIGWCPSDDDFEATDWQVLEQTLRRPVSRHPRPR